MSGEALGHVREGSRDYVKLFFVWFMVMLSGVVVCAILSGAIGVVRSVDNLIQGGGSPAYTAFAK